MRRQEAREAGGFLPQLCFPGNGASLWPYRKWKPVAAEMRQNREMKIL